MALFERPNAFQITALLRLGFAARLRSETADTFLAHNSETLVRTDARKDAAVLYFMSGDNTSVLKPIQTLVLLQHAEHHATKFLTFVDTPLLSEAPTLLMLQMKDAPSPRRMLFSLSSLSKPPRYLSVRNVKRGQSAHLRNERTNCELFHLEIIPGSLGSGVRASPVPFVSSFLTVPEAISQMLLLLGVRFRLRSVHDRVLHRDLAQHDQILVRQTGERTDINSSRDGDLVFVSSVHTSETAPRKSLFFYLNEVNTNRYLAIGKSDTDGSCARLLSEKTPIAMNLSGSLGNVNLGLLQGQRYDSVQWLMAGPRGRLEMRKDRGSWETFKIEYVQQSYNVELARLPVPPYYSIAEEVTREMLRCEITARIAVAKGEATPPPAAQSGSASSAFDHAAALAGLSDAPKPLKSPASDQNKQGGKKKPSAAEQPRPSPKKADSAAVKAAAAASASSTLPRNKANRKAAKKNRRKQKGKQSKTSSTRSQASRAKPSTGNGPADDVTPAAQAEESKKQEKIPQTTPEEPSSSSASAASSNVQGPKCAACGFALTGSVTKAMGKEFHAQCFCCGMCRRPMSIGPSQFRERNGIPFCNPCYANKIASRCARCSQPIMETVVTAMDKTWHKECLTCTICRLPLTQTFWLYADKPNEPRCSRCVTGEENVSGGHRSSRMVNLPGFGPAKPKGLNTLPVAPDRNRANSGMPGRARLLTPTWPPNSR